MEVESERRKVLRALHHFTVNIGAPHSTGLILSSLLAAIDRSVRRRRKRRRRMRRGREKKRMEPVFLWS